MRRKDDSRYPFSSPVSCLLQLSVISLHGQTFFVLFLNMWFAETAHSICGSSFYWRADLVPRLQGGKGTEGKTCLCEFVSVGHQEGSKLCSLHWRCSFLTLNDFWLKVFSDVKKRNVCRGHAEKKHLLFKQVLHWTCYFSLATSLRHNNNWPT